MRRIIVLLSVIVIGAAAPARAWCEAACRVPQHDTPSHCPSPQPAGDAASISGISFDECPDLESARPAAPARLDAGAIAVDCHSPTLQTSATHSPTPIRPRGATTVFERATPLRI